MNLLQIIKRTVIIIGDKGALGSIVYHRIKYGVAKFLGFIKGEEGYAKWFYQLYTGKELNLENPIRFDEKVWWLKLNNRDPQLTVCSDKNAVRKYVVECGYEDILIFNVISLNELFFMSKSAAGTYFKYFEVFFITAMIYLIMTFSISRLLKIAERKLNGSEYYSLALKESNDAIDCGGDN